MNLRQLAETAALASAHSGAILEAPGPLPEPQLQAFWDSSKRRLHHWMLRLEGYPCEAGAVAASRSDGLWTQIEPVLEEIFVAEILTRVWGAVLTAADRRRRTCQAEPLARRVFVGHLKARHLALTLMVNAPQGRLGELSRLDRTRRRAERWCDVLLGHLVCRHAVGDFAFDERRSRDFGANQLAREAAAVWKLIFAGLRLSFPDGPEMRWPSADHHRPIADSILGTFPPGAVRSEPASVGSAAAGPAHRTVHFRWLMEHRGTQHFS